MRRPVAFFVAALACLPAARAFAQCPDGTPPPCNRLPARGAPARRDPPLDDRFWLVLPFINTSGAADAALLTQASVNLLYQDLARWQDIRVVPDDRVADLLRSLPAEERDRPGLEAGRSLARRVGAGKLLMGDFLALGGRAQLTAKVYEVRSGRQLRLVREPLGSFGSLDSLTAGFGRIARGALAVPGPALPASSVGTASLEAYQAYVAGLAMLNGLQVDSAHQLFLRATRIDSTFALAHLRASQTVITFIGADSSSGASRAAALRFAGSLPPRERALLRAYDAANRSDYPEACREADFLLGADSTDAEAWALKAGCLSDFSLIVPPGGDSSRAVARGDLAGMFRAARRAAELDPTGPFSRSHTQFLAIGSAQRCLAGITGLCPPNQLYAMVGSIRGDTFSYVGHRWTDVKHRPPYMAPDWVAEYQGRLRQLRGIYQRMLDGQRDNWLLELIIARLACQTGDTAAGVAGYTRALSLGPDSLAIVTVAERRDLALARQRIAEAVALADSALSGPPVLRNLAYGTMLGRLSEGPDTTEALRQSMRWRQIFVGVLPAGFDSLEAAIASRLTGPQRDDFFQLSTLVSFHMRRGGPALDTAARHPLKRFQAWLARGDAARARSALAEFDSELLARHQATQDDGSWLFSAESHLSLGDSATALVRLVEWERRWLYGMRESHILEQFYYQRTTARLFGRTWLLYGDLAHAAGASAEARRAYRMLAGLWERGDPVVQPALERARARLGG